MAKFTVTVKPADWAEQLARKVDYVVRRAIELTAQHLWGEIRREAPVDHGRLAGSFVLDQLGELSWRIHSSVEYALVVHEGHGVIRPKRARALRFEVKGGGVVFARRVRAVPGNKFADRAIKATQGRIAEFGKQAAAEAGG